MPLTAAHSGSENRSASCSLRTVLKMECFILAAVHWGFTVMGNAGVFSKLLQLPLRISKCIFLFHFSSTFLKIMEEVS